MLGSRAATAEFISRVTIHDVSSQDTGWNRDAEYAVKGAGLVGSAHVALPDGSAWDTLSTDPAPFITFDLGSVRSVDDIHIWNYNSPDFGGIVYRERSVRDFSISTSSDGLAYDASLPEVRFVAGSAVPEPTSVVMLGLGAAGFAALQLRHVRKSRPSS